MAQYCVYYKLDSTAKSWSKFHVTATSSDEAIQKTMKPFHHYPKRVVLGAPLTYEKHEFEKQHGIR
jgi:hypothetical protein